MPIFGGAAGSGRGEVSKLVKEHTGMNVYVKAILVFVGDWRVKNKWRDTDTRVLTDSQLETYFRNQDQPELKLSEINLISSHLERCAKS